MRKLTKQETYDTVIGHLLDQGEPSRGADGECYYLGPRGLRCAAGAIVNAGDEVKEGEAVDSRRNKSIFQGRVENVSLLSELQALHDSLGVSSDGKFVLKKLIERADKIGKEWGLGTDILARGYPLKTNAHKGDSHAE